MATLAADHDLSTPQGCDLLDLYVAKENSVHGARQGTVLAALRRTLLPAINALLQERYASLRETPGAKATVPEPYYEALHHGLSLRTNAIALAELEHQMKEQGLLPAELSAIVGVYLPHTDLPEVRISASPGATGVLAAGAVRPLLSFEDPDAVLAALTEHLRNEGFARVGQPDYAIEAEASPTEGTLFLTAEGTLQPLSPGTANTPKRVL